MSRKGKILGSEKIVAIEKYLRGEDSLNHIAVQLHVTKNSVKQWLKTYQSLGPDDTIRVQTIYSKFSCTKKTPTI